MSCLAFLLQPGTAFCLRANSLVSFTLSRLPIPLCYQFHLETATNLQNHFSTSQTHQEYIFFPSEWSFSSFKAWVTGVLTDAPFPQQSLLTIVIASKWQNLEFVILRLNFKGSEVCSNSEHLI